MLRLQEYIELIKSNKIHDALKYAKINFPQFSDTCGPEIQQSTALLCYNPHTNPRLYKVSFSSIYTCILNTLIVKEYYLETRWSALTKLFNTTYYSMATLPLSSLLKITLQAGLASLKTQDCSTKKNYNCPTCSNIFGQLAEPLKNGVKGNSCLICSGNKSVIGSGNLPMVLPSGRVYSQSWINQMMENDGKILCMDTGNVFQVNELKKAFIL